MTRTKPRIAVYAPARNEEHNVRAWADSADEADQIVLTDTGSTDNTIQTAVDYEIEVRTAVISPWRFDIGYEIALAHVNADIDIAVPLALDERLQPGWRTELETAWLAGGNRFTYRYEWHPTAWYRHDRIHARHGYHWKYPAHETPVGPGPRIDTNLVITQPGGPGAASRNDSPLIHLMLAENPDDPRAMFYSARQHWYDNEWALARPLLTRYINECPDYDQERSEACRLMARMVWPEDVERWLLRAVWECAARRECWADLAAYYRDNNKPVQAAGAAAQALAITEVTSANGYLIESWAWEDDWLTVLTAAGALT